MAAATNGTTPTFLTPASFVEGGLGLLKKISSIPSFTWVGQMPFEQLANDDVLQIICNFVNAKSGAKPPGPATPPS